MSPYCSFDAIQVYVNCTIQIRLETALLYVVVLELALFISETPKGF